MALLSAICIVALGMLNSRKQFLDSGELVFWQIAAFLAVEFVYLGVTA